MSDFSITATQRRQLLDRDSKPWLDFDVKPYGLEPGAEYVLAWQRATSAVCDDGHVIRIARTKLWWIEVTSVREVLRKGRGRIWRARFDEFDLRDPTLYLARGRGYTTSRHRAIDDLCVIVTDDVRAAAVAEFDHQRRLAKMAEKRKERSGARRRRAV